MSTPGTTGSLFDDDDFLSQFQEIKESLADEKDEEDVASPSPDDSVTRAETDTSAEVTTPTTETATETAPTTDQTMQVEPAAASADEPVQDDFPGPENVLFSQVPDTAGQWRLSRVSVHNWGTFSGTHSFNVPREGLVITGHSGSGKSSILDAISTVLNPRAGLRYNAAADDAASRSHDRTLISYVRGAWRKTDAGETDEIVSDYLRPKATWSAVLLRYDTRASFEAALEADSVPANRPSTTPGETTGATPVVLVKLFKVGAGDAAAADVKETPIVLRRDTALGEFREYMLGASDVRRMKKDFPEATFFSTHSKFQAHYQGRLGIASGGAMELLQRTMSAKSLSSLDALFRDFMLELPTTFTTADTAVAQFGELSGAHQSVVRAREQLEALRSINAHAAAWESADERVRRAVRLIAGLDPVVQEWRVELAEKEAESKRIELSGARSAQNEAAAAESRARDDVDAARAVLSEAGGAEITRAEEEIERLKDAVARVEAQRDHMAARLAEVGVESMPDSLTEFEELINSHGSPEEVTAALQEAKAAEHATVVERSDLEKDVARIQGEIDSARHEQSSIPQNLLRARQLLAEETGLPRTSLPFAGELLRVRKEHAAWRGAIERLLRPLGQTLLVDAAKAGVVAEALDTHHFGTRIVVQSVPREVPTTPRPHEERSVFYRVEIKQGTPFTAWLAHRLISRFDAACVDAPRELLDVDFGLTIHGQVKQKGNRFEKDDRSKVDDHRSWILGFDAEDRVLALTEELHEVKRLLAPVLERMESTQAARTSIERRGDLIGAMRSSGWPFYDVAAHRTALEAVRKRLSELTAGDADLQAARARVESTQAAYDAARASHNAAQRTADRLEDRITELEAVVTRARRELTAASAEVDDEVRTEIRERIRAHKRHPDHAEVEAAARKVTQALHAEESRAQKDQSAALSGFRIEVERFDQRWPAVLSDTAKDIEDRGFFRAEADSLESDGLPEYEDHFFDMLRKQSRQNMGKLYSELSNAISAIQAGVEPVNESLRRTYFDQGRYLQIDPRAKRNADARELMADLKEIMSNSLGEESRAEAERKFHIMKGIVDRLGSSDTADKRWRINCLDTRRHVSFVGFEIDERGTRTNVYESTGGLSGGQKLKLVVFCLAAALRYRLTNDADEISSFGTVIMDEAFDKADQTFTRIAMEAFIGFGFHMILATPLKLLQTLEDYVGGIVQVGIMDKKSSHLAQIGWGEGTTGSDDASVTGRVDASAAGKDARS